MPRSLCRCFLTLVLAALVVLPVACANAKSAGQADPPKKDVYLTYADPLDDPLRVAPAGAEAPAGPAPAIVLEQAYYVPFEKIEQVFERTGRGIFLPYEKFLELWNASRETKRPPNVDPPTGAVVRGGFYQGRVEGDVARFQVTYSIEALKKGWSEVLLPLQHVAVESAELSRPDALFVASGNAYSVYLPSPGACELRLVVAARVAPTPGKKTIRFAIPPTAVSRLELTIPEEQVRVDVEPSLVVTQTFPEERSTRVLAFLGNASEVTVSWMPPAGKAADGGAIVFAQQWVRVQLLERILKIATDIDYDVQRGEVDTLRVRLPAEARLISVKGENIRAWNPEGDLLTVNLHAAVEIGKPYRLSLAFERILAETPPAIAVPFPRIEDALRESGWAVLRYDDGLNVRVRGAQGLSQLDPEEVPDALRPHLGVGFRYLAQPLALDLTIDKITPAVRVNTVSVVTLGREDDQWIGWIDYAITKAGIFRLEFRIPNGWNVDTVGAPGTVEEHHTAPVAGAPRTAVLVSLKAKALGEFRLPFRLTRDGTAKSEQVELMPPEVAGEGITQDRGVFGVAAPRNIEIVTAERTDMLDADPDELLRSGIMGQVSSQASLPRAYQYRKHPAGLKLRLEERKTEIEVLAQHLVEVTDGEITIRHFLDYNVLYAPVERLRYRAPSNLDEILKLEMSQKLQARRVESANGITTWEVGLQPPHLGAYTLALTHVIDLKGLEPGKPANIEIPLVRAADVRAEQGFVAVRKDATLEIAPEVQGMEVHDATDLPDKLRRGQIYSAFRYFSGTPALKLSLTRFDYQQLATTVVPLLHMTSTLSEERRLRTQAVIFVQNTGNQYLELQLAPQARVIDLKVAGRTQSPRKRPGGEGTLVEIPHSEGAGGIFFVQITYEEPLADKEMGSFGIAALQSLRVLGDVPVSKVELALYVPPEYRYMGWGGNLVLREDPGMGLWQRFKALLGPTASAASEPAPSGPARSLTAEYGIVLEPPAENFPLYRFDTLSSSGRLDFYYVGDGLYWFIDFLAFLFAMAAANFVLRRARSPRDAGLALIFATLALTWFATGPALGFAVSIFLGTLVIALFHSLRYLRGRLQARRATSLALAPDPFLENAPARRAEPPASGAPPPAAPGSGGKQ